MDNNIKILYVEDDIENHEILLKLLKLYSECEVLSAFDGENGLDIFKEHYKSKKIDIIVTDIEMPKLKGHAMIEQIKQIDDSVIVIYVSGVGEIKNMTRAIKTRPNYFLTKPISVQELRVILKESISIVNERYNYKKSKQLLEQYKYIVDKSAIVTKTDLEGNITYVNDEFCRISKYSKDELLGQPHNIVRNKVMPKSAFEDMWNTIKAKKIWTGEVTNKAKDGESYNLNVTIAPILNIDNEIEEYIALRHDITELKLKEYELEQSKQKALSASKAKSEFLANMSHEIRTPLNAIMGFIDILQEENKNKEFTNYIDIISDSSKNLLNIIEDILDFSKIESGKLEIENIDFEIKKEFELIIHLFDAKCLKKDISLSLVFGDNIPKIINSDLLRIKQVILNLLSNAIKFTNNGKKIIVKIDYKNEMLSVSIIDEGKGIAYDKLEYIFEAFHQEDNSTTRKHGGTGLGLSICSKLLKLMKSELKVKSKLSKGSEFYFSLPVKSVDKINIINKKSTKINFVNKKILLVEDNKANQMFMKVILKKMGLTFDITNDGVEAIEAFKMSKYNCILMDENMPNMNGIEATKQILEYEKQNNLIHTPIIALTANALKGDRERFLNAGMDEYITKPVDKEKLNNVLEKFWR